MQSLSVAAGYRLEDLKQVTSSGTEAQFPAPTATISVRPEKIFVQALAGNSGKIVIGKTGVAANGSAGGYELSAGANMTLPSNDYAHYYHIATAGGQLLQITYLSSVI